MPRSERKALDMLLDDINPEGMAIEATGEPLWKFRIWCPKCKKSTNVDTSIDKGCSTFGAGLILICGNCGYADKVCVRGLDD